MGTEIKGQIKLIITDLDGTFLADHAALSRENIQAVQAAREKGIVVSACTTRNWCAAKEIVQTACFDGVTACCNGGSYINTKSGAILSRHCLPAGVVRGLVEESLALGAKVALHTYRQTYVGDGSISPKHLLEEEFTVKRCRDAAEMLSHAGDAVEMVEVTGRDGSQMPEVWREKIRPYGKVYIANQNRGVYHITMPCASKLQAAQALARTMGLNASQVMCLGDTYNDREMIRWAGIGVAMGNAEKGVKADADYVAKDNNEHGFAQAVGRFVL